MIHRIVSAVLLAGVVGLLVLTLAQPSEQPVFLVYSLPKLGMAAVLAVLAGVLGLALRRPSVAPMVTMLLVTIGAGLMATEVFLRLYIDRAGALLDYLPAEAHRAFAERTGNFTELNMTGEGLFYHFVPYTTFPDRPGVVTDGDGFRNRIAIPAGQPLDVVFLGDSVIHAFSSPVDLADLARAEGLLAANYAMGGSSAAHYPLIFRRMVVERGIRPRIVVVGICLVNDIPDSANFAGVAARGGDYGEYLGKRNSGQQAPTSWAIHLARTFVLSLKDRYFDHPEQHRARPPIDMALPWGRFPLPAAFLDANEFPEDGIAWRTFVAGLREVRDLALSNGAERVVFLLMPDAFHIYPWSIASHGVELAAHLERQSVRNQRITSAIAAPGVQVIDMAPALQAAGRTASVSADARTDYHLNERGIRAVFEALRPALSRSQ